MSGGVAKKYSWEEIKKHNKRKDCWVVIRGKVYNVTSFLDEHPGGGEVVEEVGGDARTFSFRPIEPTSIFVFLSISWP